MTKKGPQPSNPNACSHFPHGPRPRPAATRPALSRSPTRPALARSPSRPCAALLESLGFAFLHPLEPYIPPALVAPTALPINRVEEPYWVLRAWHCASPLHTCLHPPPPRPLLNAPSLPPLTPRPDHF